VRTSVHLIHFTTRAPSFRLGKGPIFFCSLAIL